MDSLSNKSEIIIGPIISSWVFFIFNFVLFLRAFFGLIYIIIIIFGLIISTLVTLSFEKSKYCLYFSGLILCAVFDVIFTIFMFMVSEGRYLDEVFIIILIEWVQLVILLSYKNKIKTFLNNDNLIGNSINDLSSNNSRRANLV